jgi:NTE family protein
MYCKSLMYTNLVFSGGGVKGICFIGALLELEKLGFLKDIKNLAGTSVGSIIATLVALGFTPKEIKNMMLSKEDSKIDFNKIVDSSNIVLDIYHFINHYGVAYGDYIYQALGEVIKIKSNNPDYTFGELYRDRGIELIITATNLNKKNLVYFYHITYPDLPIRKAIRMSTSVPILYMPYIFNNEYYVDGGTLDNYILEVFDGEKPDDIKTRYEGVTNIKTLGFKIISAELNANEINHLYDYAYSFVETFLAENARKDLLKNNLDRTVRIDTPAYPLKKFDLTLEEKKHLIKQGKKGVRAFFV